MEEATVTFTKNVLKYRESTQSELVNVKIVKVGQHTDVEGLSHYTTMVPKNGNSRPLVVHLAAPPL